MKQIEILMTAARRSFFAFLLLPFAFSVVLAQTETPPEPSAPKSVKVPAVVEKKLPNGLTVAVVQKAATPIVTIQLLLDGGAKVESDDDSAGLADLATTMLTKGTKTRTATQIAEEIEFLGGSISSGAGWNSSFVSVTVTSDKVAQAMAILADVVLNPKFDQKELDLLKSQTLDGLTYNLKQPSFLANYVASKYSFGEHPAGGTPSSLKSIDRRLLLGYYKAVFQPGKAILIITGDVSATLARSFAQTNFGRWKNIPVTRRDQPILNAVHSSKFSKHSAAPSVKRILVVDLPQSGQAAVSYTRKIEEGRFTGGDKLFYPAATFNSVFGGGYSSRLNYEIRIRRGLSYGAGSSLGWRRFSCNFSTRSQTKNESAAEVAELVIAELVKFTNEKVGEAELVPRKSVLTGGFGRNLETTAGLANAVAELYTFDVPTTELNKYVGNVNAVTDDQIRQFATQNLLGGDIIIVGDYSIFKDDLAKRFPGMRVEVIKADELDLSKDNLRK